MNPFKKEGYSLEKISKAQQKIKDLEHSKHIPFDGGLKESFSTLHERKIDFWKDISKKIKAQQKIIDTQFELGRNEAVELNKKYDQLNEQTVDALLDTIKFRIENLGQTEEEAIASITVLIQDILDGVRRSR